MVQPELLKEIIDKSIQLVKNRALGMPQERYEHLQHSLKPYIVAACTNRGAQK